MGRSRPNTGQHAKAASGIDLRATDPLAVVEGILGGKDLSKTDAATFDAKVASPKTLIKIEKESTPSAITTEGEEENAELDEGGKDDKNEAKASKESGKEPTAVDKFEESVRKNMKLS